MAASNGFLPIGGFGVNGVSYDDADDKPMLLTKKSNGDSHGITALINRQLQGKFFYFYIFYIHILLLISNMRIHI